MFGLLACLGLWVFVSNDGWAKRLRNRFMAKTERPLPQARHASNEATRAQRPQRFVVDTQRSAPRARPATEDHRPRGDLAAAIELAKSVENGEGLGTVQPVFRLRDGEVQHATFGGVTLFGHFGIEVEYKTIHNTAFHPVGWAIDATVHKAINKRSRERAEAEAAPRWREVCGGTLHVTSRRIVLDDGIELRSWWYESLVAMDIRQGRLELRFEDGPGIVLGLDQAHVLLVLLHYLAWNDVPALPE